MKFPQTKILVIGSPRNESVAAAILKCDRPPAIVLVKVEHSPIAIAFDEFIRRDMDFAYGAAVLRRFTRPFSRRRRLKFQRRLRRKIQPVGFKSCASWPDASESTVNHDTKEQAAGVCQILEREGLGGQGVDFPVRTWVEPILK